MKGSISTARRQPAARRAILAAIAGIAALSGLLAAPGSTLAQPGTPATIGIANLGPHPSLAMTIQGFKDEMAHEGYVEGKNVNYVYSDANFTQALMPQMFSQILAKNPALILTVTTSVSQVARSAVANPAIPLVFTEVTDPVAAGLTPNWQHGSDRFNGSSDLQDFDAVLAFAKKLLPGVKSFGTLYNPGEANDVVTTHALEAAAKRAGLEFKPVSVDSVNDITQRAQMLNGVGFVYITGSNLVQSAIPAVAASMQRMKVPVISSETEAIKKGMATASYAVSLQSVGANAARVAVRVLKGDKTSAMPVMLPAKADYVTQISRNQFTKIGLTVPASFKDCKCFID
ncbi:MULTISPECIES: ABC transporter substrate-binding protein [Paraburkholderia]|uniref:ABC transport system substrate-binding protein n=1 Tax=Paraburkholderia silvatlantica TaxID=321895 RepID=A0A2U1ABK3_9BURK|nr:MULTISPECIES: ABC transporter substrate-binding protein [Paraburkholderia]MBB2930303.1 putative ABC transport system substrate-binding protein [Paraburkholderia silvatlantica]PVY32133.1 putative ABC transport system substrate-binding protein [Paraburkholderia silvatlantica]PXW37753.1 putative ABC transport system substrate-binding protein [Paraburkholderia silvatlantica]PYE25574.1 putative ABC transport system substrate-binding protein [Paraburkholderia silvatlantica]TDQ97783.1 putative ABC